MSTAPQIQIGISRFLVTAYQGRQRLFGIDQVNGKIFLFGEGKTDRIGNQEQPIADRLTTRGYAINSVLSVKDNQGLHVSLSTWNPSYSVTVNTGGVGESIPLAVNKTRSPAKSIVFGRPPYDTTNANDDHAARGREDYSVKCPFQCGSGIRFNLAQEILERWKVRTRGRFLTVTVSNASGSLSVRSIGIEADETDRSTRTQG